MWSFDFTCKTSQVWSYNKANVLINGEGEKKKIMRGSVVMHERNLKTHWILYSTVPVKTWLVSLMREATSTSATSVNFYRITGRKTQMTAIFTVAAMRM
jgi:hypothetical protein